VYNFSEYIMTFLIFALSQNGARRNDVFSGFPFSSARFKISENEMKWIRCLIQYHLGGVIMETSCEKSQLFNLINLTYNNTSIKLITLGKIPSTAILQFNASALITRDSLACTFLN
jgi:hypothetical protein